MAEVNVHILDENDLVPLFLPSNYEATVTDDLPALSSVTQVFASDADSGLNGQVYFSVSSPSDDFAVNPLTGLVTSLKSLTAGQYLLTVQALDRTAGLEQNSDSSRPPASTAQVKIKVLPSNRHDPKIEASVSAIDRENSVRQVAAIVRTSDQDANSRLAQIRLAQSALSDWFQLEADDDSSAYLLVTVPAFSFSTALDSIQLTVIATDDGKPARTGSLNITIPLTNANMSSLVIAGPDVLRFSVNETVPVSCSVGVMHLLYDHNLKVDWKISSFDDGDLSKLPFAINRNTGAIRVAKALDFESRSRYEFTVMASDEKNSSEKRVEVIVLDENDNDPVFSNESLNLQLSVNASIPLESVIGKVTATDLDADQNGKVSYRIVNLQQLPFLIDTWTGEVVLFVQFYL